MRPHVGLWPQAFIDGFSKPSYVVLVAELDGALDVAVFRRAAFALVERHPELRSMLDRGPLDRWRVTSTAAWAEAGIVVGDVQEQRELAHHLDLERAYPFRIWLAHGGTRVVARVHHAVVDAHAGRALMLEFAALCTTADMPKPASRPAVRWRQRFANTRTWLASIERSPRIPDVSLVADWTPTRPLSRLSVSTFERRVARAEHRRLREVAKRDGHTFSELLFASLFVAMHRYNRARVAKRDLPDALGLMVATSRRRRARGARGFAADTRVLRASPGLTCSGDRRGLAVEVQAQLREARGRHNDLGIAALVLASRWRRLLGREAPAHRVPDPVRAVHFMASDLTGSATRVSALRLGERRVDRVRYLVSPVAADHGGLITYLDRDELCFTVVNHDGALDADHLLTELFDVLAIHPSQGLHHDRPLRSLPV